MTRPGVIVGTFGWRLGSKSSCLSSINGPWSIAIYVEEPEDTRGYIQYMKVLWASPQVSVGLKGVENKSTPPKVPWSPRPFLTGGSGSIWKRTFKSCKTSKSKMEGVQCVYHVMRPNNFFWHDNFNDNSYDCWNLAWAKNEFDNQQGIFRLLHITRPWLIRDFIQAWQIMEPLDFKIGMKDIERSVMT